MFGGSVMDEEKVERLLYEVRNQIPVDNEFKNSLRKSFEVKKQSKWSFKSKMFFGMVTAALLFFAFFITNLQSKHVNANELLITNAISFVDIIQGKIVALEHQHNNLYVAIQEEGIFRATEKGLEKVVDVDVDKISINTEGTKLLFSHNGSMYILDLNTHQQTLLLKGTESKNYTMPVWKNSDEIYFIRQIEEENQLIFMSMDTMDEQLIVSEIGSTFDITEEFIVYEKGKKIMRMDLKRDKVTFVDNGSSPSFSQNGRYITYIKKENGVEDVWVIDTNLRTKKKLTMNLQQRGFDDALYQYNSPIWDSEENTLYLIKNRMNGTAIEDIRLMKIELGTQQLTTQETVERFMQALIVRDDDYAKSLMDAPPEYLTVSNPSLKGYKVLSRDKTEGDEQIQVEVTLADSHLPYEIVLVLDFKLKQVDGIYKIQEISEVRRTQLSAPDMENMNLIEENKTVQLFSLNDVSTRNEMVSSNIRFSSVTYNSRERVVYFAIQEMPSEQESNFGVSLWSYDIRNHKLSFLEYVDKIQSHQDIVLEGMLLSPDQKYLAVDLFSEATFTPYLFIFNLENGEDFYLLEQSHSVFWKGNRLYYERSNNGITTLHEFNAIKFE